MSQLSPEYFYLEKPLNERENERPKAKLEGVSRARILI